MGSDTRRAPHKSSRTILVLHPPGPNARSLLSFLDKRFGDTVEVRSDGEARALLEGDLLVVHGSTDPGPLSVAVAAIGIAGGRADARRLEGYGIERVFMSPYSISELAQAAHEALNPCEGTSTSGPAGEPKAAEVDMILNEIAVALEPRVAAVQGWLQLLRQDTDADDPVHRHLGHAQRDLGELGRIVRLLAAVAAGNDRQPAIVPLNELIEGVVADHIGPPAIVCRFDPAVPPVLAVSEALRGAIELLLLAATSDKNGQCQGIVIETLSKEDGVVVRLVEKGRGLSSAQLRAVCSSGHALITNGFFRGLTYPAAFRMMAHTGVEMTVSSDTGPSITVELRLEPVRHGIQDRGTFS